MAPELLYSLLAGATVTGCWLGLRVGMFLGAAGGVPTLWAHPNMFVSDRAMFSVSLPEAWLLQFTGSCYHQCGLDTLTLMHSSAIQHRGSTALYGYADRTAVRGPNGA